MASVGPGNYVVVVLSVGGTKASYIILGLQREPRTSKSWFFAGIVLPNHEYVDAGVSVLFEETNLILTVDDLTMLMIDVVLRVPLTANEYHLVYVYFAFVLVP
jgi:hypothetical protein